MRIFAKCNLKRGFVMKKIMHLVNFGVVLLFDACGGGNSVCMFI